MTGSGTTTRPTSPPPPAPEPPRGSRPIGLAIALIGLGALWLLSTLGVDIAWDIVLPAAVVAVGLLILAGFRVAVDPDGKRSRAPRNAPGNDDRGAELTERAREAQQRARKDVARRQRQRDGSEDAPGTGAERFRNLLVPQRHLLESRPRRPDEERESHDSHGDDDGLRGEHDIDPGRFEKAAKRSARAEQPQQDQARRDRWDNQW